MGFLTNFSGEFAALLAALMWAFSSVLFQGLGKTIKPAELNLIKGIGAIVLLSLTSLLLREPLTNLSLPVILLLFFSGMVGIGFGDTMYFEAINSIGPSRSLLLATLAPILTAVLALVFLGEKINVFAWLGVVVTTLGIAWVVSHKLGGSEEQAKANRKGIIYALLFALAQAIGAVISRWALTQTSISALQSASVRLFAGIIFLLVWIGARRIKLAEWTKPGKGTSRIWLMVITVIVLGAYFPLWLQQVAFKNTEVGIAQTLLATSPLFVLPMIALKKEKVGLHEVFGVIIALAGIAILFLVR